MEKHVSQVNLLSTLCPLNQHSETAKLILKLVMYWGGSGGWSHLSPHSVGLQGDESCQWERIHRQIIPH